MFSLIISIIAIALVAALTGATLYYGGDAFTEGSEKATVSTYMNQAQQITAAVVMAKAESNAAVTSMATLVSEDYLSTIPEAPGGAWVLDISGGTITAPVLTAELCQRIDDDQSASGGPFQCEFGVDATIGGGDDLFVFEM